MRCKNPGCAHGADTIGCIYYEEETNMSIAENIRKEITPERIARVERDLENALEEVEYCQSVLETLRKAPTCDHVWQGDLDVPNIGPVGFDICKKCGYHYTW